MLQLSFLKMDKQTQQPIKLNYRSPEEKKSGSMLRNVALVSGIFLTLLIVYMASIAGAELVNRGTAEAINRICPTYYPIVMGGSSSGRYSSVELRLVIPVDVKIQQQAMGLTGAILLEIGRAHV